jgi:hypothetical protein
VTQKFGEQNRVVSSLLILLGARPAPFAIANRKFTIRNRIARVAKLADAPDLGLRNRRFQNVPFRFKKTTGLRGKTPFFGINIAFSNDE